MSKNDNKSRKTGSHMSIHGDLTQGLYSGVSKSNAFASDGKRRCLGCMELYSEEYDVCPNCGFTIDAEVENALHMFPGTVLHDKYVIGKVIGYGGFGVTYLAWDTVLEIKIAIKEYLPSEFSTRAAGQTQVTVFSGDKTKQFNDGLEKFVDEAKRLAKFRNENGIVKIFDSFSENGTAYIAMEYLQGETLAERLEREKTIPVEESIQLLMPIIESLNRVHDEGIIHRDIAPDNIFLTNKGEVKLIDFGASRYATTSRSRSLTVIIKPGYSAEEQYRSRGDQGSHTDVYSVGACLYKMITGQTPPDAMERRAQLEKNHKDMLISIRKFVKDIDPRRENAIYNAMNVRIEDRTPDMISLAGELLSEEPVKRRRSGIKKIDPLTWPLWAKIGIPAALSCVIVLSVLLGFGVIGPKSKLSNDYYVPDGYVLVPNVVSTEFEKAEKKLDKIDLLPQIADKRTSDVIPRGTVLTQDPDAFNVVLNGSAVDLVYCDGHGIGFVPDVVGLELAQAKSEIENAGFFVKVIEKESTLIAPGCVISQNYGPNDENGGALEKASEVELVVSIGDKKIDKSVEVIIPNFVGLKYDEAEKRINDLNLYVKQQFVYNAGIPVDQIVGQNPPEKTVGHQGDTVTLIVNRGELMQKMPDVTMMESSAAEATLKELGLDVYIKLEENDRYKAGVVFAQSIKSGSDVKTGTKVTLTVSSGKTVTVPNVVGSKQAAAEKTLVEAGLVVNVEFKKDATVAKGKVISQSHAAGTKLKQGETVTIVVSNGNEEIKEDVKTELLSIAVERKPDKDSYKPGERIETSGMKIIASYSNGGQRDVTSSCTLDATEATGSGSMQIKVTYSEGGVNKTASFTVTVEKLSITLSESSISLKPGDTDTLKATLNVSNGNVSWQSADSKIATVSSSGTVKAVKEGSTTITANVTAYGQTSSATCSVNVSNKEIEILKVNISQTSLSLVEGNSGRLSATVDPANATNSRIRWSSSNSAVATVSDDGVVTAIKAGSTTIKATAGDKSASCEVTVTEVPVKSIEVKIENQSRQEYSVGEKFEHRGVKVLAHMDAGSKDVTDLCKYTLSGDINTAGRKTVNVEYKGKKTTYMVDYIDCNITVTPKTLKLNVGEQGKLTAMTTNSTVKWSSEDTSVAEVSGNGDTATVKGIKEGKTTIVADNGYKNVRVDVIVVKPTVEATKAEAKALSGDYYLGDTIPLSKIEYTVTFSDGSKKTFAVTGISESTVTSNVIANQSVEVWNGSYPQAKCKISAADTAISLNYTSVNMDYGNQKQLTAKTTPSNATVNWSSSGSVSVNQNGLVTATSSGSGTVTATLVYAGKEQKNATCSFVVKGEKTVTSLTLSGETSQIIYIGDKINLNGITGTVGYSDGSTATITGNNLTISTSNYSNSTGKKDVELSYSGQKAKITVEVKNASISPIGVQGNKTDYYINESFTAVVKLTPENGNWTDITWSVDNNSFSIYSGQNSTTASVRATTNQKEAKLTFKAKYNGREYSQELTIKNIGVNPVTPIESIRLACNEEGPFPVGTTANDIASNSKLYIKYSGIEEEYPIQVSEKNGCSNFRLVKKSNGEYTFVLTYQKKPYEMIVNIEEETTTQPPTTQSPTTEPPTMQSSGDSTIAYYSDSDYYSSSKIE